MNTALPCDALWNFRFDYLLSQVEEYGLMIRCPETTLYTGRIPRLHGSNTALFIDRTVRISAPDITNRIVLSEFLHFFFFVVIFFCFADFACCYCCDCFRTTIWTSKSLTIFCNFSIGEDIYNNKKRIHPQRRKDGFGYLFFYLYVGNMVLDQD